MLTWRYQTTFDFGFYTPIWPKTLPDLFNKNAKDRLFDFALVYNQTLIMEKLADMKYRRAENYESERGSIFRKYYQYNKKIFKRIARGTYILNPKMQILINDKWVSVKGITGSQEVSVEEIIRPRVFP